jgi:ribosomal protein S18 acetylase RimI-like enzyme
VTEILSHPAETKVAPELPVHLPRAGGELLVRRATADDFAGVTDLYGRLEQHDRYRRFFTGGMPTEETVRSWLGNPGNLVVVAERDGVVVADAGVARSPDGRLELGIAVEPDHRGWLGPYLLDLVLRLAADSGGGAVVAEVLATNGPMLRLLAARGIALLPSNDPAVVRLLLGTRTAVPTFPTGHTATGRPRVLLELGAGGSMAAIALERAGYEVVSCRGPEATSTRARRWRCPLLEGAPCPLVEGADAVVLADATDRAPMDAQVLEALEHDAHLTALLVHTTARSKPSEIVDAVDRAVDRKRG